MLSLPMFRVAAAVSPFRRRATGGIQTTLIRGMSATMQKRTSRLTDHPLEVQQAIEEMPDAPLKDYPGPSMYNAPVTSAHMIEGQSVSALDSVAISPEGTIIHGRYGVIPEPAASGIPLEYLALLRPAAEGAAALRTILGAKPKKGTILVYGASHANGMALCQMANAEGHAVVGVVSGDHSGNDDMVFCVKHLLKEPSIAVPEELAASKGLFRDIVQGIVKGDEGFAALDPDTYVKDFKQLFIQQSAAYPDTRPAAVPKEELEFDYVEKDREMWELNQGTFLSENYPPGAPPVDKAQLDKFFTTEQYEIFRLKFWSQISQIISGLNVPEMSPPHVVQELLKSPEDFQHVKQYSSGDNWCFSIFNKNFPSGTQVAPGGPILGAVLCVTPELSVAANAVAAAGDSIRAKAEALQFLTKSQRQTFLAAASVAQQATKAGAPVLVLGGKIPQLKTVEPTQADVKAALKALDMDDDGNTKVNFFIQSYRANDYPFYADYAIYRANEVMAGPRQYVVLK